MRGKSGQKYDGKHWEKQPRDPGGKDGGQWVKAAGRYSDLAAKVRSGEIERSIAKNDKLRDKHKDALKELHRLQRNAPKTFEIGVITRHLEAIDRQKAVVRRAQRAMNRGRLRD